MRRCSSLVVGFRDCRCRRRAQAARRRRLPAIPPELALDRTLPIDPAVKTGRLPNGLRYFIRQNARPANRVSMRLAVNAGAIQEEADQRGPRALPRAHGLQRHRELQAGRAGVVPRVDRRALRPARQRLDVVRRNHLHARRCRPIGRATSIAACSVLQRLRRPASRCCPPRVEKERGVVLEEWRGRLGAGSRLTDKQLPVIFQGRATPSACRSACPRC